MAGIDNLKNRILKEAEDSVKLIDDEAKAKVAEIINQARQKASALIENAKTKAEKDGSDSRDRIIARAKMDARNNVLSAKQEVIEKVLALAEQKIENMDSREYTEFIYKLLKCSVESGDEEVIFSEKDKMRIDNDLISKINAQLVSQNKKGNISVSSETRNIKSGFILKRGGIEINCSINSQIRILRDSLEGELAELLFGKK